MWGPQPSVWHLPVNSGALSQLAARRPVQRSPSRKRLRSPPPPGAARPDLRATADFRRRRPSAAGSRSSRDPPVHPASLARAIAALTDDIAVGKALASAAAGWSALQPAEPPSPRRPFRPEPSHGQGWGGLARRGRRNEHGPSIGRGDLRAHAPQFRHNVIPGADCAHQRNPPRRAPPPRGGQATEPMEEGSEADQ